VIESDLRYVSGNRDVLPHFAHRYGMVTLDPTIFRKWRDNTLAVPNQPKRRSGAKPRKRDAIRKFVAERYPNGIPPQVKQASICADFARETGCVVSERTLGRALGRN
jgi:hypothetical protein